MMPPDTAVVANCPNFDQDGPISCGARNSAVLRFNTPIIMRTCAWRKAAKNGAFSMSCPHNLHVRIMLSGVSAVVRPPSGVKRLDSRRTTADTLPLN